MHNCAILPKKKKPTNKQRHKHYLVITGNEHNFKPNSTLTESHFYTFTYNYSYFQLFKEIYTSVVISGWLGTQ